MPDSTREVARQLEDKFCFLNRRRVLAAYDMGDLVEKVLADVNKYGRYGAEQLSKYLGVKVESLMDMRKVAQTFRRPFVAEQSSTPTSGGKFLEFGHFIALAETEPVEAFVKVLKCVREGDLTVPETRHLIKVMSLDEEEGQVDL